MEDKLLRYTLRVDRVYFQKFRYIAEAKSMETGKRGRPFPAEGKEPVPEDYGYHKSERRHRIQSRCRRSDSALSQQLPQHGRGAVQELLRHPVILRLLVPPPPDAGGGKLVDHAVRVGGQDWRMGRDDELGPRFDQLVDAAEHRELPLRGKRGLRLVEDVEPPARRGGSSAAGKSFPRGSTRAASRRSPL